MQFYLVAYHVCRTSCIFGSAIDRFPINLLLDVSSSFTQRRTYNGDYGIATFDLSFKLDCSENYYGVNCDVFCAGVEGVSTCDSEGNVVCVDSNCSPESNCVQCRVVTSPGLHLVVYTDCSYVAMLA